MLQFFSRPPSWIVHKMHIHVVHCMLLMTHAWKMFYSTVNGSDCYGFQFQEIKYDSKSLKTLLECSLLVTISLFKLMMRPESLYEKTRSVANISSEYTHHFSWIKEESWVFDTLVHTNLTLKLTFFWHFNDMHWSFFVNNNTH